MSVAGKTRAANAVDSVNRRQRSNSPACLASSQIISEHSAEDASSRLISAPGTSHQSGISAVRKSACLGGHSLATSAAKRLLARPTCRGGRMLPEHSAKHCSVKKKKPKRTAPRRIMKENGTDTKYCHERRSEPTPASVSENVPAPVAAAKEKQKVNENVPSPSLPRIVIKIHQGKIVSPSTIASSSSSSIDIKKQSTECRNSGTDGISETKSADGRPKQGEKCERLKAEALSKPAKAVAGDKSHPKIASQPTPSRVLSARNSNVASFDSSQLQDSGSFDKLSLDYCMKLYNQLSTERTSQPPPSLSDNTKHSKTSKPRHKSSGDRAARISESKKRSVDRVKSTSEHLSKVRVVDGSGNSAKDSTPRPQNCTVQLNRIKSVNDTGASMSRLSGDSPCQIKSGVKEKSSLGRKRPLDGNMYDFAASADDSTADCSVTLNPRSHTSHSDATLQRTDIPTATETVPGSSIPLSKPRPTFSARSHTLTNSSSSTSCSPKKSTCNSTEIVGHPSSSKAFYPTILSSLLNTSVNDHYTGLTVENYSAVLPDVSHLDSTTDGSNLCTVIEAPSATEASVKIMRNSTNASPESTDSLVSDTKCGRGSESSAGRKRCSAIDNSDSGLSDAVSKSSGAKRSRMSRLPGKMTEQLTTQPPASTSASNEVSDANPGCSLLSLLTPSNAEATVSNDTAVSMPSSYSELPSSDVECTSAGTAESNTSPLRLRIRRQADMSPVKEMYNVIGSDSAHSAPSGMYRRYCAVM